MYMCISQYIYIYIYTCIDIERERERERERDHICACPRHLHHLAQDHDGHPEDEVGPDMIHVYMFMYTI